ncbi:MAG: helix-turn-helix domain-containing protein [Bacteroidota bacterium]
MKIKNINNCPLTAALSVVGGKWKPIIILNLSKSPKRFGQLDYSIAQVSRKVLSSQLSEMVRDELITRHSFSESPPRVEYHLAKKGWELVPIFQELANWGTYLVDEEVEVAGE